MMQLPELLYRVAGSLDGRSAEEIAVVVSAAMGEELTGEDISFVVEEHLRPVGLIVADRQVDKDPADGAPTEAPMQADFLLALRYRVGVVPAAVAWRIAGVFRPLFARWVWITFVAAFVAVDVWVIARGNLYDTALLGVQEMVATPALILIFLGLVALD